MRFNDNATPIMRELQAISGNEGEQVLQSLLDDYNVSIIPSEDMVDFVAYLKLSNANSLRNILSNLAGSLVGIDLQGHNTVSGVLKHWR